MAKARVTFVFFHRCIRETGTLMHVVKSQSSTLKLSLKMVKPESCDEKQMLKVGEVSFRVSFPFQNISYFMRKYYDIDEQMM